MNATDAQEFPEIGGIVHLDHVNFQVPDQDMATMFFMNGLGLARDPFQRSDETNMGVNIGMEQFHLPRRDRTTPPYPGEIGLVVPCIDVIRVRLERLARNGKFDATPYSFAPDGEGRALVRSPFGFLVRLHEAGTVPFQRPLGIAYVETWVPPGAGAKIGRFYEDVFRAPIDRRPFGASAGVAVAAGPYQSWRFVEREAESYETHSMHVSFYTTGYDAVRERLIGAGVTDGGTRDHVYFFDRVFDPATGETVFRVINEVRSLYHPDFRRPLVNRWPIVDSPFRDSGDIEAELERELGEVPRG